MTSHGPAADEQQKTFMEALLLGSRDGAAELCRKMLDREGGSERVADVIMAAMDKGGRMYRDRRLPLPDMMRIADAVRCCLALLDEARAEGGPGGMEDRSRPAVLIGVVQGDIHDMGKNMVSLMLSASGFRVHDLGRDVAPYAFVEAQEHVRADVIALSTMMTTTLPVMEETLKILKALSPSSLFLIGGASVNERVVERYGANGTAPDAPGAVALVRDLWRPRRQPH